MNRDKNIQNEHLELQLIIQECETRLDIIKHLEMCKNESKIVYDNSEVVPLSALISCLTYLEKKELERTAEKRENQLEGIKKALDLKKNGKGDYGRPKVKLPRNFEKTVRYHLEEGIPLNKYREKIGMKCSTFYKKVNEIK